MVLEEYPIHILPTVGWSYPISCKDVVSLCECALVGRRFALDCIDDSLGEEFAFIRDSALPLDDILNLSTSLLGSPHTIGDFHFIQKNKGREDWRGEEVCIDNFTPGVDYLVVTEEIIVVGWLIRHLHGRDVPYPKVFPKKKDYTAFVNTLSNLPKENSSEAQANEIYFEEYEKLLKNEKGAPFLKLNGKVWINHLPTKLNYWHFTVDLYPIDKPNKPLSNTKSAWSQSMVENVADYMRRSFITLSTIPEESVISEWQKLVC